jgi:hypothetical protein
MSLRRVHLCLLTSTVGAPSQVAGGSSPQRLREARPAAPLAPARPPDRRTEPGPAVPENAARRSAPVGLGGDPTCKEDLQLNLLACFLSGCCLDLGTPSYPRHEESWTRWSIATAV